MTYLGVLIFGMALESGLFWAFPNELDSPGTTAVMGMIIGAVTFVTFKFWPPRTDP
jgi:hypothetical protein